MARVCLALALALAAGAHGKTYKVTYTTGDHVEADSTAPMYLQLSGYMGSTPYLKLGDDFLRDMTQTTTLTFPVDVGQLTAISIKAGSQPPFDNWNAVNFINVEDVSTGEVAQFKTDFTVSGQPKLRATDYGLYEEVSQVFSDRLNHAATLPQPVKYEVTWQTGHAKNSGSKSRHFMQFVGTRARSRYYDLCPAHATMGVPCFDVSEKQVRSLSMTENIGQLTGLEFLAGGEDGWQVVDFVDVVTPSKQSIQFPANFWLDAKRYKKKPVEYGTYPFGRTRMLRAINAEERGTLGAIEQCPSWLGRISHGDGLSSVCCPHECGVCGGAHCSRRPGGPDKCCHANIVASQNSCTVHKPPCMVSSRGFSYKIKLMTGSIPNAGTSDAVFVQIRGQRGKTNFYRIHNNNMAKPGKTFTISFSTKYNIGDVTSLTLQATGQDGWYVDGKIVVLSNRYRYTTPAGWWIDGQPNSQRTEGYSGRPHAASKTFYNMKRESFAAAIGVHGPFSGARSSYGGAGSGAQNTGLQPEAHVALGNTAGHSKGKRWCQNGSVKVQEGWWGKGDGHNSCNDCKCSMSASGSAVLSCTKKSCGLYWKKEFIHGAVVCPKHELSCSYGRGNAAEGAAGGRHRLRVWHGQLGAQKYEQHRCGFDAAHPSRPCTCVCFNKYKAPPAFYQHAGDRTVAVQDPTKIPAACKWFTFPAVFQQRTAGAPGSASHSNARVVLSATNHASAWVQATHDDRFEACVDTRKSYANVGFVAFDTSSRSHALRTGFHRFSTTVAKGRTTCEKVYFSKEMGGNPYVAGSLEMYSGEFHNQKEGLPLSHWIRNVHSKSFEVCVRPSTTIAPAERVFFNFVATTESQPPKVQANKQHSEAGLLDLGSFTGSNCASHTFKQGYSTPPTVLLTGQSSEVYTTPEQQSSRNRKPISTYLTKVTKEGFTACSAAVQEATKALRTVQVDWIAVGDEIPKVLRE